MYDAANVNALDRARQDLRHASPHPGRLELTVTNLFNRLNYAPPATDVGTPATFGKTTSVQTAENAAKSRGSVGVSIDLLNRTLEGVMSPLVRFRGYPERVFSATPHSHFVCGARPFESCVVRHAEWRSEALTVMWTVIPG